MDKNERFEGQESLHTAGGPTGYLCSATVYMKLYNSAYNSCVAPPEMALFTYLLTPWRRALLDKLTGPAASQEIPRIFGTRRFLTVPTSARHLSLS
jgi:hypothetical protein